MPVEYKFIEKLDLWDCTDGEIHGGGETKELAYADYVSATIAEMFDQNEGWK